HSSDLIDALLHHSLLHLVILTDDPSVRTRLTQTGFYGERACVLDPRLAAGALPPYFASVIFAPSAGHEAFLNCLRPIDGKVIGPDANVIHTRAPLEGSTSYLADWQPSEDALVQAPLGGLWFDDALSSCKRPPRPKVVGGVMIAADKDWL